VALLPFVVLGDRPGYEIVHPMAVVILGGLVTSTLLSLFVMPALYASFGATTRPSSESGLDLMHRWAGVQPEPAGAPNDERGAPQPEPAPPQQPGPIRAGVDAEEGE
jgi:hypothetical protein